MKVDKFDFELPASQVASFPLEKRDISRLLVLHRNGSIEHRVFNDIRDYFREGDLLILNDSKVVPVRLTGWKPSGGKLEILLTKKVSPDTFHILSRGKYSGRVFFEEKLEAKLTEGISARFNKEDIYEYLWRYGKMPLPPYIKRNPDDRDRNWYQTVYAEKEGSIAAPTAGLHFTETLLKEIASKKVIIEKITLHVGIGTFKPVMTEYIQHHRMEPEEFEIDLSIKELIEKTRQFGGKVFSVGTTTTRAIESLMSGHYDEIRRNGYLRGMTDLFITPGYRFKGIDSLITNFHLPKSTPLMLASAFGGKERIKKAYQEAVASGYRFFSYGDAMLIL